MRIDRSRPPTLKDVAERANVSKQTISRVINNKGEVSEATRQRVLQVIHEIGYRPNTLARSLVTSKTHVIGLSLPSIEQPYFPQIARGVEDAAAEHGYSVFLCNSSGSEERELTAIERLRGHQVGGIISFNSMLTDEAVERTIGGLCPVVMINREIPQVRGTVIWPGYEAGSKLATEHLLSLGRRRILFLGTDLISNVDADKLDGYMAALEQAGIKPNPELIIRTAGRLGRSFSDLAKNGEDAISKVIDCHLDFDAVFASNDLPAIGALRYMLAHGIRVPDDVAIVGFGGANVAGIVTPSLSTVTMPLHEMGRTAFRTLLDRISDEHEDSRLVTVPPKLIIRESSAAKSS